MNQFLGGHHRRITRHADFYRRLHAQLPELKEGGIYFFDYPQDLVSDFGQATHEEKHKILKELGFKTNKHNKYCKNLEEVVRFREHWIKQREKLNYEIDGVVVLVNNNKIFEKLGVVGKAPRGAIAFKLPQVQATTKVLDIKLQIGRTGAVTPVAVLEPVQVSGITIARATLHNEDEIKRLGLKIGDTVIVGRAGDVIPEIVKVLAELRTGKEKSFKMPEKCPSCKTKLIKSEKEALLRCPNTKCFARQRRNFYHFVSRAAFNIDGLGPKIIDKLLDEGLAQDPSDLFELKEGDVAPLERFAAKSAENLIKSIAEKKEISLSKFIYALGIRNIGQETAMDLAEHFGSVKKIKEAKESARPADISLTIINALGKPSITLYSYGCDISDTLQYPEEEGVISGRYAIWHMKNEYNIKINSVDEKGASFIVNDEITPILNNEKNYYQLTGPYATENSFIYLTKITKKNSVFYARFCLTENDELNLIPIINQPENIITKEKIMTSDCIGCLTLDGCVPVGTEIGYNYCDESNKMQLKKYENTFCDNNFECYTNFCVNNRCTYLNMWNKFLLWFKKIFG